MRKADYAHLANVINAKIHTANANIKHSENTAQREHWQTTKSVADDIARRFAREASVNHDSFLRACGIENP